MYRIIRDVTDYSRAHPPISIKCETFEYKTIEELFDAFNKMYIHDKMAFDRIKTRPKHSRVFDESKHPGYYTFSLADRMLTVKIPDYLEAANVLFGYEKGEKHE